MKKTILTTVTVLLCFIGFSSSTNENKTETIITVTSDKPATFDFYQNLNSKEVKNLKGLKTPYQIKLSTSDGKFIFRQSGTGSKLKIEFNMNNTILTADWPVTVVIIENETLTTFGMD
jgi:phosphomannomutase